MLSIISTHQNRFRGGGDKLKSIHIWQHGVIPFSTWEDSFQSIFPVSAGETMEALFSQRELETVLTTLGWKDVEWSAYMALFQQLPEKMERGYRALMKSCIDASIQVIPRKLCYPSSLLQAQDLSILWRRFYQLPLYFTDEREEYKVSDHCLFAAVWFLPFVQASMKSEGQLIGSYHRKELTLLLYQEEMESTFSRFQHHEISHLDHDMLQLEVNLDDMNPEILPYVMERLFAVGANDVAIIPIIMKKGRASMKLQCLIPSQLLSAVEEIIFNETSSPGFRYYPVTVYRLGRRMDQITILGEHVRIKSIVKDGQVLRQKPEYEDCAQIARKHGIPLQAVYQYVQRALLCGEEATDPT